MATLLDPTALGPTLLDPTALDPTAFDPTAFDPTALDPTAIVPTTLTPLPSPPLSSPPLPSAPLPSAPLPSPPLPSAPLPSPPLPSPSAPLPPFYPFTRCHILLSAPSTSLLHLLSAPPGSSLVGPILIGPSVACPFCQEVQLPPSAQPGQKLRLNVRGHNLVFVVPPHMSGGSKMSIGLPPLAPSSAQSCDGGESLPRQVPVSAQPPTLGHATAMSSARSAAEVAEAKR